MMKAKAIRHQIGQRLALLLPLLLGILLSGCRAPKATLSVMSFNIRYDNPGDGPNAWPLRKDAVAATLSYYAPDLAGLQEVLHGQLEDLTSALPGYGWVGVGRDDGAQAGEYAPLFYKKDRFTPVESGTFWLAPETGKPTGPAWDAACARIATWARLRDNASGQELLTINTHWDHVGVVARQESAKLIRQFAEENGNGLPVVLTGDFNSSAADSALVLLTGEDDFQDTYTLSQTPPLGPTATFNGFDPNAPLGEAIDFIWVKGVTSVLDHAVLPSHWQGRFVSDHNALLTRITIN